MLSSRVGWWEKNVFFRGKIGLAKIVFAGKNRVFARTFMLINVCCTIFSMYFFLASCICFLHSTLVVCYLHTFTFNESDYSAILRDHLNVDGFS